MPKNCLEDALNALHEKGGYGLLFRKSVYWRNLHVIHVDSEGNLRSYVPPSKLSNPFKCLIGFDGIILDHDPSPAPPIPKRALVGGSWILAVGVTVWAIKRWFRRNK